MQHNKGTKSISEIDSYCQKPSNTVINVFMQLLAQLDLRYINQLLCDVKKRGVKGSMIFQTLFVFRFLDLSNVAQLMQSGFSKELSHKKDVFYDFLNNSKVQWRRIMKLFFKQILTLILAKSEDKNDGPKFLVVDDTILGKLGKKIEFIGKVYNHCSHVYELGMKVLTLGYTDGKSFLPIDFSIHNEAGKTGKRGLKAKELKSQFTKTRDPESAGYERSLEVEMDKISVALQMIKRCKAKWLKFDYVLADSWFICEKFITGIKNINKDLQVMGLMKTDRFVYINGKKYKASKVPELKRKYIKTSKKFKCQYISFEMEYKGIEMRGYWVKMNRQQNWNLLISTHKTLTFCTAMEYYKNRWSIEVFFKDCKQNLGLGSCQSTDFDAHIATTSIIFMNYAILALKKRFEDYETLGILFRTLKEQMIQQTVIEKVWNIFIELIEIMFFAVIIEWEQFISELIQRKEEIFEKLNNKLNIGIVQT